MAYIRKLIVFPKLFKFVLAGRYCLKALQTPTPSESSLRHVKNWTHIFYQIINTRDLANAVPDTTKI